MRMQYLRNKKTFSNYGTIFEVEGNAIKTCHIPYCGMNSKTARRLSEWLLKRADDLDKQQIGVKCENI